MVYHIMHIDQILPTSTVVYQHKGEILWPMRGWDCCLSPTFLPSHSFWKMLCITINEPVINALLLCSKFIPQYLPYQNRSDSVSKLSSSTLHVI